VSSLAAGTFVGILTGVSIAASFCGGVVVHAVSQWDIVSVGCGEGCALLFVRGAINLTPCVHIRVMLCVVLGLKVCPDFGPTNQLTLLVPTKMSVV